MLLLRPVVPTTGLWVILTTMKLDAVDQRIVGALQVDGRAPWRRIASVIDVPFSTVVRRGNALLERGAVRVRVVKYVVRTTLVEIECSPAAVEQPVRRAVNHQDSIFVFVPGNPLRVSVEMSVDHLETNTAVAHFAAGVAGMTRVSIVLVVDYDRTIADWMPDLITASQAFELNPRFDGRYRHGEIDLDDRDESIVEQLSLDPRATANEIGRTIGLSESIVRRRIDVLIGNACEVRAIVSPTILGLRVAAFVWLTLPAAHVEAVVEALLESTRVRCIARLLDAEHLVFDVAAGTVAELNDLLVNASWAPQVTSMRVSTVVSAH